MFSSRRVKFSFVHGFALGFELFDYARLYTSDDIDDDATAEDILNHPETSIKRRAGLIVHLGPFKVVLF